MKHKVLKIIGLLWLSVFISNVSAEELEPCALRSDCLMQHLEKIAGDIEKDSWRDQTYRELAKTMAADGRAMQAISLIEKIINPDTKALTIRGIGMEAAMAGKVPNGLFQALRMSAEKISHPPSYGIALTYIAMAQAFAGDDDGARRTASEMENDALRNKAYGETAEIQAEQGKFEQAIKSISFIEATSFKNKAYKNISRIFAEGERYVPAYDAAQKIENTYMQAQSIQFILDHKRIAREKAEK